MEKVYPEYYIVLKGTDGFDYTYRENGRAHIACFLGGGSGWEKRYKRLKSAIQQANRCKAHYQCNGVKVCKLITTEKTENGVTSWTIDKTNEVVYEV